MLDLAYRLGALVKVAGLDRLLVEARAGEHRDEVPAVRQWAEWELGL